jgi:hypothetical protein
MPNHQPPPGVHWVEIYDEMADDPEFDPNWIFDLLHPDDCSTIEEPMWAPCPEHAQEIADNKAEAKEKGWAFHRLPSCATCDTFGDPRTRRADCPFEWDRGNVGDDAYAAGEEWPKDRSTYFHERSDLRAGTFRVTWEYDGAGEDFTSWIEVHEAVEAKL